MSSYPVSFRLDDAGDARRLLEAIAQRVPQHRLTAGSRTTIYYDSFDWRVFRHGTRLRARFEGPLKVLSWLRSDGEELHRAPLTTKPGFAWELPGGPLREGLAGVLEMRRLLPLFSIEARTETLNILDRRRKTVARAEVEILDIHPAGDSAETVEPLVALRALPVRGYEGDFSTLLAALEAYDLAPMTDDEFTLAAAAVGLQPGGYSRRLDLQLDPEQRADEALRTILRRLLEVMRQNEPGLRSDLDSEFLHDFRVAVRRTRSALSQLKGVLSPAAIAYFKREFSWLGQITGPTRDLDVYLLKMPDYRASLPTHVHSDLEPLHRFLERHQRLEHQELVQLLDTERYASLLGAWSSFLHQPFSEDDGGPEAATPVLDLASRRIWRSARRVLKKGDAIHQDTPAAALHRLRIECKKLRYLLEFFRSLYPEGELTPLINALKRLQDNLGDFNDLEIQQAKLKQFAQTMEAESIATVSALMAMGRLVERLEHRQVEERHNFHKRFARFSKRRNRRRFETLFKPPTTGNA